jgi:hypothetical protein
MPCCCLLTRGTHPEHTSSTTLHCSRCVYRADTRRMCSPSEGSNFFFINHFSIDRSRASLGRVPLKRIYSESSMRPCQNSPFSMWKRDRLRRRRKCRRRFDV